MEVTPGEGVGPAETGILAGRVPSPGDSGTPVLPAREIPKFRDRKLKAPQSARAHASIKTKKAWPKPSHGFWKVRKP